MNLAFLEPDVTKRQWVSKHKAMLGLLAAILIPAAGILVTTGKVLKTVEHTQEEVNKITQKVGEVDANVNKFGNIQSSVLARMTSVEKANDRQDEDIRLLNTAVSELRKN